MDPATALSNCRALCARQERCRQELRLKLTAWEVADPDRVIKKLEKEGFLNEARYAEDFAVGHFRQKGWGKYMIRAALQAKGIPDALVEAGLAAIDAGEYERMVRALVKKRLVQEKERDPFIKQQRVIRYLIGRGWEADEVHRALSSITKR